MMKKDKKLKISLIAIGFLITIPIIGYFVNASYHTQIKSKKKMYCYQQYWGVVNPVLYVKEKQDIDSLIVYYSKIEHGELNPTFNFPPLSLPYDTCVYVLGYEKDSTIAKVICYYDWGRHSDFVSGYVYRNTLHNIPPPDSLITNNKHKR